MLIEIKQGGTRIGRIGFSLMVLCCSVFGCRLWQPAGPENGLAVQGQPEWKLIYAEEFSDNSFAGSWHMDGSADVSVKKVNGQSCLKIETKKNADNPEIKRSVYWCKQKFEGNLRFVFRVKGQAGNQSIFYFNAKPTPSSGYETIFDRHRPNAFMSHYAGSEDLHLYSVGILLTEKGKKEYLRYLGGEAAEIFNKFQKTDHDRFDAETGIATYGHVFEPDKWYEFDLRLIGNHITMYIDSRKVIDVEDTGNAGSPGYEWTPPPASGWIGFRNWKQNAVWLDYIRVYRQQNQ